MVTVDKYIRKLLFEQDCVIIPEFGGLLTHHIQAHYDSTLALFTPSSKRVAFNEVLKLDDGLLTYYISVHERIPREEAVALVKKYVETLRTTLKEGQTVTLDAIGSFSANSEGKPVFEPDYTQNFNNDWYGLEPLEVRLFEEKAAVTTEMAELVPDLALEETEPESKSRMLAGSWVRWAAAAVFAGAVFTLSLIYKPADNSLLSTLNPVYSISELYVSALAKFPQLTTKSEVKAPESKVTEQSQEWGAPIAEAPMPTPTENKEVVLAQPEVTPAPVAEKVETSNGDYYLIAGSFGKMKNAVVLKNRLVKQGFTATEVMDAVDGRLIKVSVGSYKTMRLALVDKDKVDEITEAESWVYRKK
jgi:cell division septation protein DedD